MTGEVGLRFVGQVGLAGDADAGDRAEFARDLAAFGASLEGVAESHASPHLDLSVGGLDLTWDLRFATSEAAQAFETLVSRAEGLGPLQVRVEQLELGRPMTLATGLGRPGLVGVKRTLWLRVEPEASPDDVARFEAETPLLAKAVPAIRNWRWSRLTSADHGPMETRWTHLWEQEFETVDGLQVDYMSSPVHWGHIDRWFDPEMPDRIVDLWLAHTAYVETAPVLSWGEAG